MGNPKKMKRSKLNKHDVKRPKLAGLLLSKDHHISEWNDVILCAMNKDDFEATEALYPDLVHDFLFSTNHDRKRYNWPQESEELKHVNDYFDEILKNVKEKVKGKLSKSKEILKNGYYYFSREQQVSIMRVFLKSETSGDRYFVYEHLNRQWWPELTEDVLSVYRSFTEEIKPLIEEKSGKLSLSQEMEKRWYSYLLITMSRKFPEEIVKKEISNLSSNSISYFYLCKRFGKEKWFAFNPKYLNDGITIKRYLEALSETDYPITDREGEELFFKVIAIVINEFLNPTNCFMKFLDKVYHYEDKHGERHPVIGTLFDIKVYLLRMGHIDLVKKLCKWQEEMQEKFYPKGSINYYPSSADYFRILLENFPPEYKSLLDDSEFESKIYFNLKGNILLHPRDVSSIENHFVVYEKRNRVSITVENLSNSEQMDNKQELIESRFEQPTDFDVQPF